MKQKSQTRQTGAAKAIKDIRRALGYRPPAPEAIVPIDQKPVMH